MKTKTILILAAAAAGIYYFMKKNKTENKSPMKRTLPNLQKAASSLKFMPPAKGMAMEKETRK
tara:strand:+ start:549 stop:737 length:189 start_codon:yes stop_codon:yes gene_type:complete